MKRFFSLILLFAILWLGGLIWFAQSIPESVADTDSQTDAIVVLTGGSQRLENGVKLLAEGKAHTLFVSGVAPAVELPTLLKTLGAPDSLTCCIVLGHAADNTRGNAIETAAFMRDHHYQSLRLVTSAYHMPRSLYEFRHAMPEIAIIPNPVFADNVKQEQWWAWPGTLNLVINEYNKYLAAVVRSNLVHEAQGADGA